MTFFIRILLAAAFIPAFIGIVRLSSARSRALRILMFLVLVLMVVLSLIFPAVWDDLADLVGINSGLDLLVYVTILALMSYIFYGMSKFKLVEKRLTVVTRELALLKEKLERN
jgi:small membrane protein